MQRATAQNPRQGSNRKAAAAPSPGLIQDSSIQKTKFHNIGRFTCPRDDHLEGRNGVFISCRTCLTYRFHRRGPCITSRHNPGMLKKNRSLTAVRLVLLALAKDVAVLLERRPCESSLAPQVGGKESVCVGDGNEGGRAAHSLDKSGAEVGRVWHQVTQGRRNAATPHPGLSGGTRHVVPHAWR